MWPVSIAVVVAATVVVLAVVGVRGKRRQEMKSPRDVAARAIREMSRDSRRRRGQRVRGTGAHFGRTPIKKYGDERHGESEAAGEGSPWGGGGDSGGGGGGSD